MTLSMASSTSWRLPASTVLPGPDSCASTDSLAVPRAACAARREARRAPTLRKAKKRPDERTRTADLLQLRVIIQVLQGLAGGCKYRISKLLSFLRVALRCTVLRSRWYQSGIRISRLARTVSRTLPASRTVNDGARSNHESPKAALSRDPIVAGLLAPTTRGFNLTIASATEFCPCLCDGSVPPRA
jgi:hypothetical protein